MLGGWLRERVPRTLAGNFFAAPGARPGKGRGRRVQRRPPAPLPRSPRCCPTPSAGCAGSSSVFARGTVTSALFRGGSRGRGLRGWDEGAGLHVCCPLFPPVKLELLARIPLGTRARRDETFGSQPLIAFHLVEGTMLAQPAASPTISFLRSSGPVLLWQPLGRVALRSLLPSSLWDVSHTVHVYFCEPRLSSGLRLMC